MKPMIGDMVGVVKMTKFGRVLDYQAKLVKVGFGRKTTDMRALAEPGEVTEENEVVADGWSVVQTTDGKMHSASTKLVKLYTQALVQESNESLGKAQVDAASTEANKGAVEAAKKFAEDKGLDVSTLTDANLMKIHEILRPAA